MNVEWDAARPAESLMKVMKVKWNDGPILRQENKENYALKGYKEISAKELLLYVLDKYKDVRFTFPNVVSQSGEVIFSENENPWFVLASLVSRVEEMKIAPTPNTAVWVDQDPDGALVMRINTKIFQDGVNYGSGWNNGEAAPALGRNTVKVLFDAALQAKLISSGENPMYFDSPAKSAEARGILHLYELLADYNVNVAERVSNDTMSVIGRDAKGARVEFNKGTLSRGRVVFSSREQLNFINLK
jgi:hypothetical protein